MTNSEMEEAENTIKHFRVSITAEWTIDVEATDEYDAELLAEDYVHGTYGFEFSPDYFDAWAEEIT